jgi:hypothetical protein
MRTKKQEVEVVQHGTVLHTRPTRSEFQQNLRALERVTYSAMEGEAFLTLAAQNFAGNDPIKLDGMNYYIQAYRLAFGHMLGNLVDEL